MLTTSIKPFPVLQTPRLTLRALSETDVKDIYALRSDKLVNKYLDRQPAETINDAASFIAMISNAIQKNESLYWVIMLNESDQFAGTIALFNFSDDGCEAETGYELLPAFQQQGIMQEAIAKVISFGREIAGFKIIHASTHRENKSSSRLLEKLDFKMQEETTNEHGNYINFKLIMP